ncbi:hypothetical protein GIB67_032659 [Kingdonia uniflora]|uniref:Kinesin motor domain-containing protein n=1 Tax=Kingdonia uniflora TaxID=39325 RepID=A0A7J7MW79_9MAGN|nr:hypothetical protein GIB67_032659 [Kingdonia uniflora]
MNESESVVIDVGVEEEEDRQWSFRQVVAYRKYYGDPEIINISARCLASFNGFDICLSGILGMGVDHVMMILYWFYSVAHIQICGICTHLSKFKVEFSHKNVKSAIQLISRANLIFRFFHTIINYNSLRVFLLSICAKDAVYAKASPAVTSVLDEFNVCIFACGQTGIGKTFTMRGTHENRRVNYKTLEQVFRMTNERSTTPRYELFIFNICAHFLPKKNIKIYTDDCGKCKGDAVLSYEDPSAAHSAGGFYNNHDLRGYTINVAMAKKSAPRDPSSFGHGFYEWNVFHPLEKPQKRRERFPSFSWHFMF